MHKEMEFSVKKYCWRELELLTDSFSEENFIGNIKHGKVYRGKTEQGQEVTVKIWFRFESQNRDVANRHANYSLTRLEVSVYLYTLHHILRPFIYYYKIFIFLVV